jgi:hypothetical protein
MEPLSINGPIPFGRHRDGTYASAAMRQKCVAIVGTPGSGKTVVEQAFVAGLVRCPDALVWPIDLSNGGLTNPWLGPWLDGDMESPVLDWCAFDIDEALLMTEAALQIIDVRRLAYRRLMRARNTDKLPCSHDLPAIYLLLDEGKEATGTTGNQQLIRNLIRIADKGRAVAVRIIITALRGTSETIPKEMMADIGARLAMNVAEDNELAHVLGWKVKYNARDFPYEGCGLWRDANGGAPQRFRSFDLSQPSSIERIASACERWRPALDEPSASVPLGSLYESRWDRALPILQDGGLADTWPASPQASPQASPRGEPPASPAVRARRPSPASPRVSPAGSVDVAAAIEAARRDINLRQATTPRRVDTEWERLAEHLADDRAAGGEGWGADPEPDPKTLMLGILDRAGTAGMSGPKMHAALAAAGIDVSPRTVYRWLNDATETDPPAVVDAGYGAYVAAQWRTDK